MSGIDKAVSKAVQELERLENSQGAINLYTQNNLKSENKLGLSEEFTQEIATQIATTIEDRRIKKTLKASVVSLLKSGSTIHSIISIDGILDHLSIEEIIEIKKSL